MTFLDETQTIPMFPLHYRIRLACEMAGVEADELAELLDVHVNTAHNYMSGRSKPRRPALKEIAKRTRVSLQWLETGDVTVTGAVTDWYDAGDTTFDDECLVSAGGRWHPASEAA